MKMEHLLSDAVFENLKISINLLQYTNRERGVEGERERERGVGGGGGGVRRVSKKMLKSSQQQFSIKVYIFVLAFIHIFNFNRDNRD